MVQNKLLLDFFQTGNMITVSPGQILSEPDKTPRGVMYIESGIIKTFDLTKYNEENLLNVRQAGEIVGLTWAFRGRTHNVFNQAMTVASVWIVSPEAFIKELDSNPSFTRCILELLAEMYRIHGERIMTLEYRSVQERLASFLIKTSERFGEESDNNTIRITAPLKQQDIASSISATRETTGRALAAMQRQNLITLKPPHIYITNLELLSRLIT